MIVVPFEAGHIKLLNPQPSQVSLDHEVTDEQAEYLATCLSFTGLVDGKPVACSGVTPFWGSRGVAWAILDKDCGPHFTAIHKAVYAFLEVSDFKRVEAYVDLDFKPAHRWMKMLGFDVELPIAKGVLPSGRDGAIYSRFK
jgi:hypothetical protein